MEGKFRHGIWKMNGRQSFIFPFYTNSILDFAHGIYRKIYTDSDNQKHVETFRVYGHEHCANSVGIASSDHGICSLQFAAAVTLTS